MSFFNDVYGDRDLSARTKTVCLYLHDRANSEGESWYAIGTIAAEKQPPHQGEAAPIDWTWGRVIAAHPEGPRRRIIIFREQKYIPLLISPVPVVIQRHFPDMVIGCHAGE